MGGVHPPVHSPAVAAFRALHASGCFILPNPWDVGSAWALYRLGFPALATSSAGVAFSRGLPDDMRAMPCAAMLTHIAEIVGATPLPVNADFQAGYADEPEQVAANVVRCVATGAAGLSIEDATGDPSHPLYARELAVERVRAARAAIDGTGSGVVLTARCEAWLVGDAEPARTAIDRLVAFAAAGADCVYAPGVRDPALIATRSAPSRRVRSICWWRRRSPASSLRASPSSGCDGCRSGRRWRGWRGAGSYRRRGGSRRPGTSPGSARPPRSRSSTRCSGTGGERRLGERVEGGMGIA